jgi:hypothetical protein
MSEHPPGMVVPTGPLEREPAGGLDQGDPLVPAAPAFHHVPPGVVHDRRQERSRWVSKSISMINPP